MPPLALCAAGSVLETPSRVESGAGGGLLGPNPARCGGGRTGSCLSLCPLSCLQRDVILAMCQGLRWPHWQRPTAAAGTAGSMLGLSPGSEQGGRAPGAAAVGRGVGLVRHGELPGRAGQSKGSATFAGRSRASVSPQVGPGARAGRRCRQRALPWRVGSGGGACRERAAFPLCSCLAAYLGHSCAKHKYVGRRPGALAFLGVESAPANAA